MVRRLTYALCGHEVPMHIDEKTGGMELTLSGVVVPANLCQVGKLAYRYHYIPAMGSRARTKPRQG